MQARLLIICAQCNQAIDEVKMDTADMADQLQQKINKPILEHQDKCSKWKYPYCPKG